MMKKKWIALTLGLVLVSLVIRTLYTAGSFKTINNHFEGTSKKIYTEMPGTEDLDADYDKGWLFISSSDRWKSRNGEATGDGIFLLSMDSAGSPKKLVTTYKGEFHPHGISYWKTDSASFLFVVNHNKAGNFIELFNFSRDTLFHLKSISNALMFSPNDVVAVDKDKFYVTNDHGNPKGPLRTAEEYLQIPLSYVLYYNGEVFTKVWTGINYGNGINVSRDGEKLFLATTTGRTLLTFNRNSENGSLTLDKSIDLGTGIDNISVDTDGTLWIAAHPKMLAFVSHAKDPAKHSPSQILKLTPDNRGDYQVSEIYMNDGSDLSGSSVALHYKNEVFVGVVFESKLLRATLAP
jgi:arylesterase / paraoxonase